MLKLIKEPQCGFSAYNPREVLALLTYVPSWPRFLNLSFRQNQKTQNPALHTVGVTGFLDHN